MVESVAHCLHSVVTNKMVTKTTGLLEQLDLSPHMVSIQWAVESMSLGRPVTGLYWKNLKGNLCEFVQLLVKLCQYSIIYDHYHYHLSLQPALRFIN